MPNMYETIYAEFDALSNQEKRQVMFDAMDWMQQFNGRSKMFCFASAMGYTAIEHDDGSYTYQKGHS